MRSPAPRTPRAGEKRNADVLSPLSQRPPFALKADRAERTLRSFIPALTGLLYDTHSAANAEGLSQDELAVLAAGLVGSVHSMTQEVLWTIQEGRDTSTIAQAATKLAETNYTQAQVGSSHSLPNPFNAALPTPPSLPEGASARPPSPELADLSSKVNRLAEEVLALSHQMASKTAAPIPTTTTTNIAPQPPRLHPRSNGRG